MIRALPTVLTLLLAVAAMPAFAQQDLDQDGYNSAAGGDCDDTDAAIYPGAEEICDEVDNDCDGDIDEGFDLDDDGWLSCKDDCDDYDDEVFPGHPEICDGKDNNCDGDLPEVEWDEDADGVMPCEADCDDENSYVHPDMHELCDGIDNNCDDEIDEYCYEDDNAPVRADNESYGCAVHVNPAVQQAAALLPLTGLLFWRRRLP